MKTRPRDSRHPWRAPFTAAFLLVLFIGLAVRAVTLHVFQADYLQREGTQRHSRVVKDNSHRGMILDRTGSPLAVSTPVDSVWAHPETLATARKYWPVLEQLLELPRREISQLAARHAGREFMYLKRHVTPDVAARVMAHDIPGVALQREYRRYYPAGTSAGHVVGFTNIDDSGQEGLELAYDEWLRASPGRKRVLKDMHGNVVETVESLSLAQPGRDLVVSLDRRIQYLAYRELKAAVLQHRARAGAAIVLDAHTFEVLALVNEPDFNPNNRNGLKSQVFRNRAVTDLFEPGSTIKPFTVAAALDSGRFSPHTVIETGPGTMLVSNRPVRDTHNYGTLTVTGVLEKSSNVGAAKIALALGKKPLWEMVRGVGFGAESGSQLPGEVIGLLNPPSTWVPIEQATFSFGYGLSITPLQLARAYAVIANGGMLQPVTLQKQDAPTEGTRVMTAKTAHAIVRMLERAVGEDGTGAAAQVADYRVAGKTGTVHKLTADGYADDRYVAWFAGFAPASDPRLVMVVMVDEPSTEGYFGGRVAAPVFGRVMAGALRLLDVPADVPRRREPSLVTASGEGGA